MMVPSAGWDYRLAKTAAMEAGFTEEEVLNTLKVFVFKYPWTVGEPYTVELEGRDINKDAEKYLAVEMEIIEKTGEAPLHILGIDTLVAHYSPEEVLRILGIKAVRVRETGTLIELLLKRPYHEQFGQLTKLANIHLKLLREHGVLLIYGVKPRTELYTVEADTSMGYPMPRLTPII
jgi:hypothetical protein